MRNHFTEFFVVVVKGAMYYVAVAMVILSHVKITCFCPKAHLVFHWRLYNNYNKLIDNNIVIPTDYKLRQNVEN